MPDPTPTPASRTAEDLQPWLVDRLARYLDVPAERIDPEVPFAALGLDSVYAFAFCGEIEDALDVTLEPTLLWDVDTLGALTAHLAAIEHGGPVA